LERPYPAAVACLTQDLPELSAFLQVQSPLPPAALRTTNAIERRFREVRRRTRPMGTFSDHTSIDRILFTVFSHENHKEGTATPFLLTQTLLTLPVRGRVLHHGVLTHMKDLPYGREPS